MEDCQSKGRAAGGNRKHLTEAQVQEIRRRLNGGMSPRIISQQMDINYGTISSIRRGDSYGWISQ
jgi:DNA-binding CsgD family transcriptional regulator